jgi:hypothetical protein
MSFSNRPRCSSTFLATVLAPAFCIVLYNAWVAIHHVGDDARVVPHIHDEVNVSWYKERVGDIEWYFIRVVLCILSRVLQECIVSHIA